MNNDMKHALKWTLKAMTAFILAMTPAIMLACRGQNPDQFQNLDKNFHVIVVGARGDTLVNRDVVSCSLHENGGILVWDNVQPTMWNSNAAYTGTVLCEKVR